MSLAAPWFLAALALIPLGAAAHAYARRRQRRFAVRFPATATLAALAVTAPGWRRRIPPALLALAAAALAVALARPHASVAVPVERATVVLVSDASRSMLAEDVFPSRLEATQQAAERFLDRIPERLQVGLVGYSTTPHTVLDPTLDHEQIRLALLSLQADGGTATGDALKAALQQIRRVVGARQGQRRPPAAIVLLSDGKSTDGENPVEVARQAGRLGVPIYTVALGTPLGTVPGQPFGAPIAVPPDPETMLEIAEESGGQAFEVSDSAELDRIYERLGSRVGTRKQRREVTAAFAAAGLVLLLGAAGTGVRWRGRLP